MAGSGVDVAVVVPLDAHDDVAGMLADYPKTSAAVAGPAKLRAGGARGVESIHARRDRFGFQGLRTRWLDEPGQPVTESPSSRFFSGTVADRRTWGRAYTKSWGEKSRGGFE